MDGPGGGGWYNERPGLLGGNPANDSIARVVLSQMTFGVLGRVLGSGAWRGRGPGRLGMALDVERNEPWT